jgi:hypothetical protein
MLGCLQFVWPESLKCKSTLKQGRKIGFKNRHNCRLMLEFSQP